MTYDHWKATNPDDEWLGPDPDEEEEQEVMAYHEIEDALAAELRRFHRDSCYPEAMDFEVDRTIENIRAILADAESLSPDQEQ